MANRTSLHSASAGTPTAYGQLLDTVSVKPAILAEEGQTVEITPFPVKDGSLTGSTQQIATPGFGNASGIPQFERQHRNDNFPGPSTVVQSIITGSAERPIFSTTDYRGGTEKYTIEFQEISLNTLNIFKRGPDGTDELLQDGSGIPVLMSSSTKDYQNFYFKGQLQKRVSGDDVPLFSSGDLGWRRIGYGSARGVMSRALWQGTTVSSSPIIAPAAQQLGSSDYKVLLSSGKTSDTAGSYVELEDSTATNTDGFNATRYAGMSVFVELLDSSGQTQVYNKTPADPINWVGVGVTVQQRYSRGAEWYDANVAIEASDVFDASHQRQRNDTLGSIMAIKRWTISGSGGSPNQIVNVSDYTGVNPRFMFNITFNDDGDDDFGNNMRLQLHPTGALDRNLGDSGYVSSNYLSVKVHAVFHKKLAAEGDVSSDTARALAGAVNATVITGV